MCGLIVLLEFYFLLGRIWLVTIGLGFVSDCNVIEFLVPVLTLGFWAILVGENDVPSCVIKSYKSQIRNDMIQLQYHEIL